MPDDSIIVEIGADVSSLNSGLASGTSAFMRLAQATSANTKAQADVNAAIKAVTTYTGMETITTKALADALQIAAAATAELKAAQDALATASVHAEVGMSGLERAAAGAGGRILGMEAGFGMAGGAIGRVAAQLPGLGEAFALALPVALVAATIEKTIQFREEIQKAVREDNELAIASYKVADGIQLENAKLQDQISKLEGFPAKNLLKEALLEDKAAAEDLSKSLADATQKSNELLTVGFFSQFLAKASGDEAAIKDKLQPILDQITTARLKLAQAPPGSDAAKTAIQEEIGLYKQLNDQLDAQIDKLKKPETLYYEKPGGGEEAIEVKKPDYSDTIAKLQDMQIVATNASTALKAMNEQAPLRVKVAGLEEQKEQTADTERQIEAQAKLQETLAKTAEVQAQAATARNIEAAKSLPELDLKEIEAKKKAMADALEEERKDALAEAAAEYQIEVEKTNKLLALNEVGSDKHNEILDKQKQAAADYDQQVVEINKSSDEKIADSNRELEQKYREMLDKEAVDAENAANRMAALEIEINKQAQQQILEDDKRTQELHIAQMKASMTGLTAGPIVDAMKIREATEEYQQNDNAIQQLNEDLAKNVIIRAQLNNIVAAGGQLTAQQTEQLRAAGQAIAQINNQLGQLRIKQAQLQAEMLTSWQQIKNVMVNSVDAGFNSVNQNILKMLTTTQSFSKSMINIYNSMMESLINGLLKFLEQRLMLWLENEIGIETGQQNAGAAQIAQAKIIETGVVTSDAGIAGAAGFASAMEALPFPANLATAPGVGAAAESIAMSYLVMETGGIVPGRVGQAVPVVAHAGEAVLPRNLTSMLSNVAAGPQGAPGAPGAARATGSAGAAGERGRGGNAGGSARPPVHMRTSITIHQHGSRMSTDEITKAVKVAIRRGSLA